MTPEQLREWADAVESGNWPMSGQQCAESFRAHASAMEEIERLKKERDEERNRLEESQSRLVFSENANKFVVQRAERAEAALAECRTKLEVDPRTKYDGISCRDETIRLLEAALAESERKCERLKFHAEAAMSWIEDEHPEEAKQYLPDFVDAYRAEFKEE